MKTVNQKANVGEKILITNARENCLEIHGYDNGDKFIVRNRSDNSGDTGVIVDDEKVYKNDILNINNFFFIYDHEYEVIENED